MAATMAEVLRQISDLANGMRADLVGAATPKGETQKLASKLCPKLEQILCLVAEGERTLKVIRNPLGAIRRVRLIPGGPN